MALLGGRELGAIRGGGRLQPGELLAPLVAGLLQRLEARLGRGQARSSLTQLGHLLGTLALRGA